MKVVPTSTEKNQEGSTERKLTPTEKIMRRIALILAFVTVFGFFIKILFL